MLDFACSLYLGLRHPHSLLAPWRSLTSGAPAALDEPAENALIAHALSKMMGCGRGVIAPSTLHLFWDLFGILSRKFRVVFMDAGTYPIARWGIAQASGNGVHVMLFPHHDAGGLRSLLSSKLRGMMRPLIVSDGVCPACGRVAPISEYLTCAKKFGGLLVLDDTQSLGILGQAHFKEMPYGTGGGGSLPWSGIENADEALAVSSLAKGFGVPIAVLTGSVALIKQFENQSSTRVHCSPPSTASVVAAARALTINNHYGDALRLKLLRNIVKFKSRLEIKGLYTAGGIFPVQTLKHTPGIETIDVYGRLLQKGIRTVLRKERNGASACISLIITAGHSNEEINRAADAVIDAMRVCRTRCRRRT